MHQQRLSAPTVRVPKPALAVSLAELVMSHNDIVITRLDGNRSLIVRDRDGDGLSNPNGPLDQTDAIGIRYGTNEDAVVSFNREEVNQALHEAGIGRIWARNQDIRGMAANIADYRAQLASVASFAQQCTKQNLGQLHTMIQGLTHYARISDLLPDRDSLGSIQRNFLNRFGDEAWHNDNQLFSNSSKETQNRIAEAHFQIITASEETQHSWRVESRSDGIRTPNPYTPVNPFESLQFYRNRLDNPPIGPFIWRGL